MVRYADGIEIKVQAKNNQRSDIIKALVISLAKDVNISSVVKIGSDRVSAIASISRVQRKIDKFLVTNNLKKSQIDIKTKKIIIKN